jgi:glycosyltransferase involved in cell wall biosynthesis
MRIGIYVEVARGDKPTGIGLHVRNLVNALAELDRDNEYLLYYVGGLWGREESFGFAPLPANFRLRPVRFPRSWPTEHPSIWWKWYLPRVLRRDRIDVFHGPNHYLPRVDGCKTVVTIHDLAYFRMNLYTERANNALKQWTRNALDWAGAVIALSENTRRDVEDLQVPSERIRVIYGGGQIVPEDKIRYDRRDELKKTIKLPEKFILFVGTLLPRKNVPFLLRAYARLKQEKHLPHGLVLAGARSSASEEIDALIQELGIASDVIVTGYVDDWQMPLLYKMADLFVLPTLYEGFTLVTLEAMAYGTPVIATDTSSIREGVGDAAMLVEVNDVPGLATAMSTALTDGTLRRTLVERGRERARMFTWERCAQQTLELYRELADNVGAEPVTAHDALVEERVS